MKIQIGNNANKKHSSRMRTDRAITRPSSEPVFMRSIVDRQTPVKTLPSLAVGNKCQFCAEIKTYRTSETCFGVHYYHVRLTFAVPSNCKMVNLN